MTTLYVRKKAFDDSNMIPMINVVFLLLIFFMIAGQIKPNLSADINLPTEDVDAQAELNSPQIEISADGQISFGGERIELNALESILGKADEHSFLLLVDRHLTADKLDSILDVFRRTGSSSIKFIIKPSSGAR